MTDELELRDANVNDPEPGPSAAVRDLDDVDWRSLWDEVGCSVDEYMSATQLRVALEVSDQDIGPGLPDRDGPGDGRCPDGLIDSWTTSAKGVRTLRGYVLSPEVRPNA